MPGVGPVKKRAISCSRPIFDFIIICTPVRSEVLTVAKTSMSVNWIETPCGLVVRY
jgi:hypothetical protein